MAALFICYIITNAVTGKKYVGITKHALSRRWRKHWDMSKVKSPKLAIHRAMAKYGETSFQIEHVASARTLEDLPLLERDIIRQERSLAPNGYNLTSGGDGIFSPSDETRAKMRASKAGRRLSAEHRAKLSCLVGVLSPTFGKKRSEETRAKISAVRTGSSATPETRAIMSAARIGIVPSPECRRNISNALKGKPKSDEARRNMSKAAIGKVLSPEHRANIAAGGIGRTASAETRTKRSASLRRFHEAKRLASILEGAA